MTIKEMHSWFDILQAKGLHIQFTSREKDHILNRAQIKFVNEVLQKKYKLVKHNKYARGEGFVFSKKNKDPKSIFSISYAKSMAGPYISYDGVLGE